MSNVAKPIVLVDEISVGDGREVCEISLLEIATIMKKMFNITPEVTGEQSLEQQGREHSVQYTMKSEDLEDTSILQFKRLCTNHIRHMTPELDIRMAVIMGKKMPHNTGMALEFELRTQKECPDKNGTVAKCLKRIKLWCVVGGCYTLISVVLIHQCLLGLLFNRLFYVKVAGSNLPLGGVIPQNFFFKKSANIFASAMKLVLTSTAQS
jgi:hypothetical protein